MAGSSFVAFCFIFQISLCSCMGVYNKNDDSLLHKTLVTVFVSPEVELRCHLPTVAQQVQCLTRSGLQQVLESARLLATDTCKEIFKHEAWNCLTPNKTSFNIGDRETAFLYSLYTATLAYRVTEACRLGELGGCGNLGVHHPWSSICPVGDNVIRYSVHFTRSFLHITKPDRLQYNIGQHNANMGIKVLQRSLKQMCRTGHYNELKLFRTVIADLKTLYHSATLWEASNSVRPQFYRHYKEVLLYESESPQRCGAAGRECLHQEHCRSSAVDSSTPPSTEISGCATVGGRTYPGYHFNAIFVTLLSNIIASNYLT